MARKWEMRRKMNILTTISEAMQSSNQMDRETNAILGLCEANPHNRSNGYAAPYSVNSRRRERVRRAA